MKTKVKHSITIYIALCILFSVYRADAETYYVWAVSGLNIRDKPGEYGRITGRLPYGEKLKIDVEKQTEEDTYHEVLMLPGIHNDGDEFHSIMVIKEKTENSVYLKGNWIRITYNGQRGYIFSGYLSRLPVFRVEKDREGRISYESELNYFKRCFTLTNCDTSALFRRYSDNITRNYVFKEGIIISDPNPEYYVALDYCFANLTMNEALLFIKVCYGLEDLALPLSPEYLNSGDLFYGQESSEYKIEIHYPAPDGKIIITIMDSFTIISVYGTC